MTVLTTVEVLRIYPHPSNIRADLGDLTEMVRSVKAQGVLEPLIVTPRPGKPGTFFLLAGHRRLEAAKIAGVAEVPVVLREAAGGARAVEVMLVENCQRADLSPVDKAEAMGRLRSHGYSAALIASRTGLSGASVSYYLSLLDLDEATRERVRTGVVSVGDAIGAVRSTRKVRKKAAPKAFKRGPAPAASPAPKVSVDPPWFTSKHPLAEDARIECELAGHNGQKLGKSSWWPGACGRCWESVIRRDERGAKPPAAHANGSPLFMAPAGGAA